MSRFIALAFLLLLSACAEQKMPGMKIGKPYVINGESYYPSYDPSYDRSGTASWYGPGFHGKYTASGEVYDQNDYTAAHPTLPMPSLVRVTNLDNGRELVVRINDRGPFKANRLIDLSKRSAEKLGIKGLAKVRVQFLEQETQRYMEAVKANNGRIVRMADYHQQSASRQLASVEKEPTASAPVVDVASVDSAESSPAGSVPPARRPSSSDVTLFVPGRSLLVKDVAAADDVPNRPLLDEPSLSKALPSGRGNFAIQVGAFASEDNAYALAEKLASVAPPLVESVRTGERELWRVRLGNFSDRLEAERALERVRASGVSEAHLVTGR